jgi:hypothetical protein
VGRSSRWLIILPALWFALTPQSAKADPQPGLNAVGYTINQIPPLRSDSAYPQCGIETENNINRNFEGEPFTGCGTDWFMLHYTGFITIPDNTSVKFMVAADDGGTINIDGHEFGTWNLKGCSWSQQVALPLSGGTYPLDGWFFEAGGGTCYMLAWQLDDGYWEIVPEWAYTTASTPVTTTSTSTVPSTTVPVTTTTSTTVQETTTTVEPTTTTEESTTTSTTEAPSTTTSTSTTSTTSSTTLPPSTTTTADTSPPATIPTPIVVVQEPSTTTEPATTVPEELPQEEQPPLSTDPEVPDTTFVLPPEPEPTLPDPQEPAVEDAPTMAPDAPESSESDVTPEPELETPETLLEALDEGEEPTAEQAATLATSPQVLATVSTAQAEAIFQALDIADLSPEQTEALIEAVQDAPLEIRETFEETVDIFKSGLDTYIPVGSNIPVGTRRTLVAIGAVLTMLPPPTRIRN